MINKSISDTVQESVDIGRVRVEAAAAERLLNAYLRETGVFDPRLSPDDPRLGHLPALIVEEITRQGAPMRVVLEATGVVILGSIPYFSAFGHHRYGRSFWITQIDTEHVTRIDHCRELAKALLNELAASATIPLTQTDLVEALLYQLENSLEKTRTYVERSFREGRSFSQLSGAERFYTAEQSLVYGHPFHPAPKSSQGFSAEDLVKYAPEMGASFVLHYFACAPEIMQESFVDPVTTDQAWIPAGVMEAAKQQLGPSRQHYRLLPCHPWQAKHLKQWGEVQDLLDSGLLVDLGELGGNVYPTSSVRTVWDPDHHYFFKLPLNVRITHFIRVNPLDQLERTMDASRVLAFLAKQMPFSTFTILLEAGYRTIAPARVTPEQRERLTESFGVIFRENPITAPVDKEVPVVVAAALEQSPHAEEPPLMEAVRMAARQFPHLSWSELLEKWLRQYLEISLVPLLWLFVKHGVSMEAHVQNSMVALRDGWPVHFYVRDLEGVSIGRTRARQQAMFHNRLAEDSPVLYTEEEAWNRFKYYVVVNHLGHLIHTLAYYGVTEETSLWKIVAEVVQTSRALQNGKDLLLDLMQNEGLPAKANLISSFHQRGERPLYVTIPNPLAHVGGNV
jgi:L-2,3-diaminopropanoate---citrate ligase